MLNLPLSSMTKYMREYKIKVSKGIKDLIKMMSLDFKVQNIFYTSFSILKTS